jgi:hypothetical protein
MPPDQAQGYAPGLTMPATGPGRSDPAMPCLLSDRAGIQVAAPIKVRRAVALDRRATQSAKEKLAVVCAYLASTGLATDLDLRQVNLVGRLDPIS